MWSRVTNDTLDCTSLILFLKDHATELQCIGFHAFLCNGDVSVYIMQHRIQWLGRGGGKKHEIYGAAFGDHLFYDLFLQGWGGGMAPSEPPPWIRYCNDSNLSNNEYTW